MEKQTFILESETEKVECEVLYSLYSNEYQKHYLVYTDNSIDQEGDLNILISSYDPESTTYNLYDITDEEELSNISDQLEKMWEE